MKTIKVVELEEKIKALEKENKKQTDYIYGSVIDELKRWINEKKYYLVMSGKYVVFEDELIDKLNELKGDDKVNNDLANVMGSFIETELNAFEEQNNELKNAYKEIERLNNIIDAKDYKIKRLVYSCYESDMSYGEFKAIWVNAFEKLYDPKDIDKLENELKGDNK